MEPNNADAVLLHSAAEILGLTLSSRQIEQFLQYRKLLQDWNTRLNLTGITESDEIITRHFIDSLSCMVAYNAAPTDMRLRLLDVGSGAGFPGIALAIAHPDWQIVSLEATAKKVRFQEQVLEELSLTNVTIVYGRAEVLAHELGWRGTFNVVTARALAPLPTLLEWCQPFARVDGYILAYKKGDIQEELEHGAKAAQILGGELPESIPLPPDLLRLAPDLDDDRVLIRIHQVAPSPPRYPRSGATPTKSPLG
jgi:16S rRNA (guanine527-N7)-methyltransferase